MTTNDDTSPRAKAARELREACENMRREAFAIERVAEAALSLIPNDVPETAVELKLAEINRLVRSMQTSTYVSGVSIFDPTPDVLEWARAGGKWAAYSVDSERGVLRCYFDDTEFTIHGVNRELQLETEDQAVARRAAATAAAQEARAADCTCAPDGHVLLVAVAACPLHGAAEPDPGAGVTLADLEAIESDGVGQFESAAEAPEQVDVPSSFAAEFKGELL
jgi:hypothetical protein